MVCMRVWTGFLTSCLRSKNCSDLWYCLLLLLFFSLFFSHCGLCFVTERGKWSVIHSVENKVVQYIIGIRVSLPKK